MMSIGEQAFVYNLARNYWRGDGIVLDAGLMCGASTFLFGKAIEGRSSRRHDIVAIDMAIANPGAVRFIRRHVREEIIEVGEDFSSLIERFIAPVRPRVDLRIGDICTVGATTEPIEILFLDVLKSEKVSTFAFTNYIPFLIRGGFIIQQDYFCDFLPWIREMQESLHLTGATSYIGEIGSMAIFKMLKPVSKTVSAAAFATKTFEQSAMLLSLAEQRSIDPARRLLCALSRVWRSAEKVGKEKARTTLEEVKNCYLGQIHLNKTARIRHALKAAQFLTENSWSDDVADKAALIAAGHDVCDNEG